MSVDDPPSLEEFLAAPPEMVARVTPATVVYQPGGSRRAASVAGVPLDDRYAAWTGPQLVENLALFFRLGVQDLIVDCIGPRNLRETGAHTYGQRVIAWAAETMAGPTMLAEYQARGWQARILASPSLTLLTAADERLREALPEPAAHTVWWYFVADDEDPWRAVLDVARQSGAPDRATAIRALYGRDVAPAELHIGFGKPVMGTTIAPPLLIAAGVHGYWTQRPGLTLSEHLLR
ncbi:MAG: hypothetical protein M3Z04_10545, partial [Chloroflexota bacterium]|nr:hypothetical protein [Chloroflexota bacterium]